MGIDDRTRQIILGEMSAMDMLINFSKGDFRNTEEFRKIIRKKSLSVDSLQIPFLELIISLDSRRRMLMYSAEKTLQASNRQSEKESIERENSSPRNDTRIYVHFHFESFLDIVYKITENISMINRLIFYDKVGLKNGYHDQVKAIRNGKLKLSETIDNEIINNHEWYDQVHNIRSEITHYLSGIVSYGEDDESGSPTIQYSYYPVRNENDYLVKHFATGLYTYNVVDFINDVRKQLLDYLDLLAYDYLKYMDKENEVDIPLFSNKGFMVVKISYQDYLLKKPAKIIFPYPRGD